jgi:hypothetical protein
MLQILNGADSVGVNDECKDAGGSDGTTSVESANIGTMSRWKVFSSTRWGPGLFETIACELFSSSCVATIRVSSLSFALFFASRRRCPVLASQLDMYDMHVFSSIQWSG